MPKRLGTNKNEEGEWLVVYNKTKVVASFRLAMSAHAFVDKSRKEYFDDLEVLTKDVWEYRKEKQEKKQKKKQKEVSL